MSPPKNSRGYTSSPTKSSPSAKKVKMDNNSKSTEVKGQPQNMAPKAKRQLLAAAPDMQTDRMIETPPQWFISFFAEFEERLEHRLDSLFVKRLDDLTTKVTEQDEKMRGLDFDIQGVHEELKKLKTENSNLINKLDDLENRGRRNNLVIFGLPEPEGREDCMKTVTDLLHFVEQPDATQMLERCHRTPTHRVATQGDKPRMIHVAFRSYVVKEQVRKASIQKLKNSTFQGRKIFVAEDFSKKVNDQRKKKMEQFKKLKLEGKQPFFVYPDKIKFRDQSGKIISVD